MRIFLACLLFILFLFSVPACANVEPEPTSCTGEGWVLRSNEHAIRYQVDRYPDHEFWTPELKVRMTQHKKEKMRICTEFYLPEGERILWQERVGDDEVVVSSIPDGDGSYVIKKGARVGLVFNRKYTRIDKEPYKASISLFLWDPGSKDVFATHTFETPLLREDTPGRVPPHKRSGEKQGA